MKVSELKIVGSDRVTSADDLETWVRKARAGQSCIYYEGHLAQAVDVEASHLPEAERRELVRLAAEALTMAQAGIDLLHLTQRRVGQGDDSCFQYIATRRGRSAFHMKQSDILEAA